MADLQIDPDAINRYVAEMIVESSIGEALKKAIDEEVKAISRSYDNPMKHVVAGELQRLATEYLQKPEVQEQLRAVIESKMTPKVLEEIVDGISLSRY